MMMAEGYRRLAVFEFEEAEQHFKEVHHKGQGKEEETAKALHACSYWQTLVKQNKENPESQNTGVI